MADTEIRTIETRIHGRFLLHRTGDSPTPAMLVGFHGYAQSADEMIEPLLGIAGDSDTIVISIQALNRFYNVKEQTVVANWMTKQDRELMIEDNVEYVSAVVDEVRRELRGKTGRPVFVGFSQGSPMAYRGAVLSGHDCAGVIILGGDLPPDFAPDQLQSMPPVLIGRGSHDEWLRHDVFQENVSRLESAGRRVETYEFDGGHEWIDGFIQEARSFVDSLE